MLVDSAAEIARAVLVIGGPISVWDDPKFSPDAVEEFVRGVLIIADGCWRTAKFRIPGARSGARLVWA